MMMGPHVTLQRTLGARILRIIHLTHHARDFAKNRLAPFSGISGFIVDTATCILFLGLRVSRIKFRIDPTV